MRGIHNDNNYLRMLAQSQALAQAASELGKEKAADRARAQAAEALQKARDSAKAAEDKKITPQNEQAGDGNQQSAPGYQWSLGYNQDGKLRGEGKEESPQSPPPPGIGRLDIRV